MRVAAEGISLCLGLTFLSTIYYNLFQKRLLPNHKKMASTFNITNLRPNNSDYIPENTFNADYVIVIVKVI